MTITGETISVVAPATLNAGYTFDAVVEGGKTIAVTVPTGGVKEGQVFDAISSPAAYDPEIAVVPNPLVEGGITSTTSKTIIQNSDGTQTMTEETTYPDGRITKSVSTIAAGSAVTGVPTQAGVPLKSSPPNATNVPTGAWRYDLFSCFDTCDNGMFWMSWCCTYIAMGQLLQRLKLNMCGLQGDYYKNTCIGWTILWAISLIVYCIVISVSNGYGVFFYYILALVALAALTNARYYMRQKWSIPADCCDGNGCLGDCCCVFWCNCCSIIQMMRHTHDERVDYYSCGSVTGLNAEAPEVV